MNIYLIYKFYEYEKYKIQIDKMKEQKDDFVFYFTPDKSNKDLNWKEIAEEKIKNADVVIYLRQENQNYIMDEMDNIIYEIQLAQQYLKQILIYEDLAGCPETGSEKTYIPQLIYVKNYLDKNNYRYKTISSLDIKSIKANLFDLDTVLFPNGNSKTQQDSNLLLEEYKIMIDTSEKMMDRRQGTNNFYITLCSAILTVMAGLVATKINTLIWCIASVLLSLFLLILCHNWRKTLEAYGLSNQAKYEILNRLEKKLPASIFDGEWEYGKKINYSSYSKREALIPKVFMLMFVIVIIAMLSVFILTLLGIVPMNLFSVG